MKKFNFELKKKIKVYKGQGTIGYLLCIVKMSLLWYSGTLALFRQERMSQKDENLL